jgi:hypothetical protein
MNARLIASVWLAAFTISPVAAPELRAGAAQADITPPVGGAMYGYGARGANVSTGVHDPLYAKALVLENGDTRIAWVTLDWGTITEDITSNVRRLVEEETGITRVLCSASHTHSAPQPNDAFPPGERPYLRMAEEKIAGAVAEAAKDLRPARIRAGWGRVEEGHNRRKIGPDGKAVMFWENRERVPTSPVDYSLGVIRVESRRGRPIATLVNFQCHPVVLGPENLEISADYPGVFTRLVEDESGGLCMFLQGAAGDINPFWDKTPPAEGAFEQMEKMGGAVAAEVIRVSREALEAVEDDPELSFHTEIIPLAERDDRERLERDLMAEVNTVLIGDAIALATFPGEFFVEHGLRLKHESTIEHTFFVGYTNRGLRYFPTIHACTEGGYGADSATIVEIGAGEMLVNRALINLYYQAGLFTR